MTITVVPTGALGVPLKTLHDHVAQSAAFVDRAMGGADDVHIQTLAEDLVDERLPYAIVGLGSEWNWQTIAGGYGNVPHHQGQLALTLAAKGRHPGEGQEKNDCLDFCNWADGVIADLWELAGESDNLDMTSVSLLQPPMKTNPRKTPSDTYVVWSVVFGITYNERQ